MGKKKERARELAFTKRALDALRPPPAGRLYIYDARQPNLALCVTPAGTKTFYRTGRVNGRPVRVRLGSFPDLSVENARKAARATSGEVARGVDPRRPKAEGTTVADLFAHWLVHARRHKKTWKDDERQYRCYFKPLARRRLADVSTTDVARWHAKLGDDHGPYMANRCISLLSAMYGRAHELGFDGLNPCKHVKRFAEQSRERFLQQNEIRPFFSALKQELPIWRDFWLICLFTGARRGNVASMRWADLDLARAVWHLPAGEVKNKRPTAIVLPPPAQAILEARAAERNGNHWVFPADSASGHLQDPRASWTRVTGRAGLTDLRPHDLRRTLGSWQAAGGVSLQVIGRSLGHHDLKSTQVYSRLELAPVRAAVDAAVLAMIEAGGADSK